MFFPNHVKDKEIIIIELDSFRFTLYSNEM